MSRRQPFKVLESLNKSAVETGRVELSGKIKAAEEATLQLQRAQAERHAAEQAILDLEARELERLRRGAIRISDLTNAAHFAARAKQETERLRSVEQARSHEQEQREKERTAAEASMAQQLAEGRALERHQLRLEKVLEQAQEQKEEDAATDVWNSLRSQEKRESRP